VAGRARGGRLLRRAPRNHVGEPTSPRAAGALSSATMLSPALRCFAVDPLPRVRRILRRYQGLEQGWNCGPKNRHEANVTLDDVNQDLSNSRRILAAPKVADYPGWPERCAAPACPVAGGYVFKDGDLCAVMHERLGRRRDTGATVLYYEPPPGAVMDWAPLHPWRMYPSLHERYQAPPPDGRGVVVALPHGALWCLDVAGPRGERFERRGELEVLSAVQVAGPPWGWTLHDGELTEMVATSILVTG
jgi:hypothetical protein